MKARLRAMLDDRTRQRWPDEPDRTHLDYVSDYRANGGLLRTLASSLDVSHSFLTEYLRNVYGAVAVREALSRAREDAADAFAEESIELADTATPGNANAVGVQVKSRQWLAEKFNPRDYGKGSTQVTIHAGALMLAALQTPVAQLQAPAPTAIAGAIADDAIDVTVDDATPYAIEQPST